MQDSPKKNVTDVIICSIIFIHIQGQFMTLLFVCSRNKKRSPTAAQVARNLGMDAMSGGLDPHADYVVGHEDVVWATNIICMEERHCQLLSKRFGALLSGKKVEVWNVQDQYQHGDPDLIQFVERKLLNIKE